MTSGIRNWTTGFSCSVFLFKIKRSLLTGMTSLNFFRLLKNFLSNFIGLPVAQCCFKNLVQNFVFHQIRQRDF